MADGTESSASRNFAPGHKDANSYSQDTLKAIVAASKCVNELPTAGDDFDYYSTFPGFRAVMQSKGQKILSLMNAIIQNHGVREKFQGRELEEKFDLLIDANDVILEKAGSYLDEASGVQKPELIVAEKPANAINTSWNKKRFKESKPQTLKLLTAKNIARPQLSFKDKIDNSNSVFVPILKEKPNSIKPLAVIVEKDGAMDEFCHPYELEIEKFSPDEIHLQHVELQFPKPSDETPMLFVKTLDLLIEVCEDLKLQTEFAVDLEHHSYRSFQGFTCLMQISTRERDYIIDALELRSELHVLNEVFTDPKIVKVFHGADMDIVWLQRDFGIYVVNLFDTGQAARVLQFAHLSLSYLLKHYCKMDVDKRFQLADWRMRPLPEEMIKYAREDTHFLLYICDCMKNDLLEAGNDTKNLLRSTFDRSKVICQKRYQKALFSEDSYLEMYRKSRKIMNPKQLYCLKQLFSWRDKIAREYDESTAYVLPNHMLLQIAEALPREQQGILACCNPIPPLVKQQLNELHSIVLKTNESSMKELEMLQLLQQASAPKLSYDVDLSSLVHCPHDIHHLEDKADASAQSTKSENLLPLIKKNQSNSPLLLKKQPTLKALFEDFTKQTTTGDFAKHTEDLFGKLLSPFERYKQTEEFHESEQTSKKEIVIKKEAPPQDLDGSCILLDNSLDRSLDKNTSQDSSIIASTDTSEISESTPIGKKKNKKRKIPEPDIPFASTPQPPSKKSKTPQTSASESDTSFKPYDYSQSQSVYTQFTMKKSKDASQKQGKSAVYQTPKPYMGRKRKHAKQMTYSGESNSTHSSTSKWPKN